MTEEITPPTAQQYAEVRAHLCAAADRLADSASPLRCDIARRMRELAGGLENVDEWPPEQQADAVFLIWLMASHEELDD